MFKDYYESYFPNRKLTNKNNPNKKIKLDKEFLKYKSIFKGD